jgi:hypothetical protein
MQGHVKFVSKGLAVVLLCRDDHLRLMDIPTPGMPARSRHYTESSALTLA